MTQTVERRTFACLDALRGVAALLVVFHHEHLAGIVGCPPAAYLAVDLFFLMSGFVIAHAYEEKLRDGLAPLAFMRLRLIRLYPLYLLGSVLGLAVAAAFWRLSAFHTTSLAELARVTSAGLLLAPTFSADPTVMTFPLNGPAWSLFFELAINLVYAVVAVRLSTRSLAIVCAGCAALLAILAFRGNDLNLGFQTLSFVWGAPRVAVSFFGGVLIYRLYRAGRLPALRISPLWALLAGSALLFAPTPETLAGPFALAAILVGFPCVLILAVSCAEPEARVSRWFGIAGEASYPLYAIHGPIVVGLMMASRFWDWDLPSVRLEVAFALPIVLAGVGLLLSRVYDRPVRAWITRIREPAAAAV